MTTQLRLLLIAAIVGCFALIALAVWSDEQDITTLVPTLGARIELGENTTGYRCEWVLTDPGEVTAEVAGGQTLPIAVPAPTVEWVCHATGPGGETQAVNGVSLRALPGDANLDGAVNLHDYWALTERILDAP